YLTENDFINITTACTLPRYMNLALFRAIDTCQNDKISFIQFQKGWKKLTQGCHDFETFFYNILKKPEFSYITPDDFLPILEDVVLNHPALQFLEDNMTFQERYIETVICRIFYDANCPTGKMTLNQFKKSGFSCIIKALDPMVDLYTVYNVFSYKQFYVIYCKLWSLDTDHDLLISEDDLFNYNMGTLTHLVIKRITQVGHISAFSDTAIAKDIETRLSYFDFIWFLLSEIDKATPMAIDYWFKCLDLDGDGIISSYELHSFWDDQDIKQRFYGVVQPEGIIRFEDIIRQINDLIQPRIPGQFLLSDLRKSRFLAERFFDTFINFDRFQIHEA
ncbi:hypothetical protein K501DRAFT_158722, partial [Backusella circina FSU 941]